MNLYKLHEGNGITWTVIARNPAKPDAVIDTNEYLITVGKESMLLDPGGSEIFPAVLNAVSQATELKQIRAYLCSHQDPDIMSSLPLWMDLTPDAKIYVPWLWSGFISHFGYEYHKNFVLVPDQGMDIQLGDKTLNIVPAHFLHSPGNIHLFDPSNKILFTGDVGAALLPPQETGLFVQEFSKHIRYMEKFHRRWMPSNTAKARWIRMARKLNPRMLCPQHGAIFKDENVVMFLDWFQELEVGSLDI